MKHSYNCIDALRAAGIAYEDATALRRISMTLHRWHELECGDANGNAVERGWLENGVLCYSDHGKPYLTYDRGSNGKRGYTPPIPDRERGALRRLDKIMARYPGFAAYVQGDPRGCALYILRPGDVPADATADSCYNRGIAVCK